MALLTLYRWRITDERTGRPRTTRHHLSEADALAQWPGATPVECTRVEIRQPGHPGELSAAHFQQSNDRHR